MRQTLKCFWPAGNLFVFILVSLSSFVLFSFHFSCVSIYASVSHPLCITPTPPSPHSTSASPFISLCLPICPNAPASVVVFRLRYVSASSFGSRSLYHSAFILSSCFSLLADLYELNYSLFHLRPFASFAVHPSLNLFQPVSASADLSTTDTLLHAGL